MAHIRESKVIPLSSTVSLALTVDVRNMSRARYDAKVARFAESFLKVWRTFPPHYRRVIIRWLRVSPASMNFAAWRKDPHPEIGKSIPLVPTKKVYIVAEVGTGKHPYRNPLAQVSGFGDIWFSTMMLDAPYATLLQCQMHELLHMYCWERGFPTDKWENDPYSETHVFISETLDWMLPGAQEEKAFWLESRRRTHKGASDHGQHPRTQERQREDKLPSSNPPERISAADGKL